MTIREVGPGSVGSATVRVAVAQFYSGEDVRENLDRATGFMREAAAAGVQFIVMPENANRVRDFASRQDAWDGAETLDGVFLSGLRQAARELGMYVSVGVDLRADVAPDVYIGVVLIGPDGEIINVHHKTVLWDYEYDFFVAGSKELVVSETAIGRIGIMSCADGIVPEVPRILALKGAQILANSLNSRGPDEMRVHEPLRAIENHVWHLAANTVGGPSDGYPWTGGSQIVSPTGAVVANAGETAAGLAVGDICPVESFPKVLGEVGSLNSFRRPELYGELLLPTSEHSVEYGPVPAGAPTLPLKIAALQTSWYHSTEWTLRRVEGQIAYAAERGVELAVFPELLIHRLDDIRLDPVAAAALSAETLRVVRSSAEKHSLWVAVNIVENEGDAFYSTLLLVDDEGNISGKYRKVHLNASERQWAKPGDEFVVVRTPIGAFGLMIGDEVWLPEVARILSLRGAEVILHPTSWDRPEAATMAATERTEENRVHLVSCSRTDNVAGVGSQVVLADRYHPGQPIALMRYPSAVWSRTGFEENIIYELDLQDAHSKMMGRNLDPLASRQPALYGAFTGNFSAV